MDAPSAAKSSEQVAPFWPLARRWLLIFGGLLVIDAIIATQLSETGFFLALFPIRLAQAATVAIGAFFLIERIYKRNRFAGQASITLSIVLLFLLCGLSEIYPILGVTHYEVRGTLQAASSSPGVVYERIDPPIERETTFLIVELNDKRVFIVEEQFAPQLSVLTPGTEVVLLRERIGRRAYTEWLMPFGVSKAASRMRIANS